VGSEANSGTFVTARMWSPLARRASTYSGDETGLRQSASRAPSVRIKPATSIMSFTRKGTPANTPSAGARMACSRACSKARVVKAPSRPSSASIRSIARSTHSTGATSPRRTHSPIPAASNPTSRRSGRARRGASPIGGAAQAVRSALDPSLSSVRRSTAVRRSRVTTRSLDHDDLPTLRFWTGRLTAPAQRPWGASTASRPRPHRRTDGRSTRPSVRQSLVRSRQGATAFTKTVTESGAPLKVAGTRVSVIS